LHCKRAFHAKFIKFIQSNHIFLFFYYKILTLMKKTFLTLFTVLCAFSLAFSQTTRYVVSNATGNGNGLSWANAHTTLQAAITAAVSGDIILVKKGIYRPASGSRSNTITIDKSLTIHGSCAGTEASVNDRTLPTITDPDTVTSLSVTILSGDINNNEDDVKIQITGNSDNSLNYYYTQTSSNLTSLGDDNAYTVVTISGADITVTLTGLYITAGNAYDSYTYAEVLDAYTAAFMSSGGNTTAAEAAATAYAAYGSNFTSGAAIRNLVTGTGGLTLTDCQFSGNFATKNGGAISSTTAITATRVSFLGNAAAGFDTAPTGFGGAVYSTGGTFNAVSFIQNGAAVAGGGLYTTNGATLNNVAFASCQTSNGGTGAGVHNASGTLTATNCTFVGGSAVSGTVSGSAIYNNGTCTVVNSIVDNTNNNFAGNNTTITYSIIDGTAGTVTSDATVLTGDPMLVSTTPATLDLNLQQGSPCINTGSNSAATSAGLTTDIQGATRFYCDDVDMGATERSSGRGLVVRDKAAVFNGSASITLGTGANNLSSSAFTIEAWIKPTVATGYIIFSSQFILGVSSASKIFFGSGGNVVTGATALTLGEWYHIAATSDGNIYVNGKLETTTGTFSTGTAGTITIGSGFNGQIEELRLWDDVRTEAEIRKNMRLLLTCGAADALATYQFNGNAKTALEFGHATSNYDSTATSNLSYTTSDIAISHGNAASFTNPASVSLTGRNSTSIGIVFTAALTGDVVVSYLNEATAGTAPWNSTMGINNYQYVIDNYTTSQTPSYTVTFANSSYNFGGALTDYKLERRGANATGAWDIIDPASGADEAITVSNPNLAFTVTNFELGQLFATKGAVLPVQMTAFTATLKGEAVVLDWQTASEENNAGFEVFKSDNGNEWKNIGFVEGNGTTLEVQNYQFVDKNVTVGTSYYRLKQLDLDGQFDYSEIRSVFYDAKSAVAIYPNPAQNDLTIALSENTKGATVQLYDITGRLVVSENTNQTLYTMDCSKYENGIYVLRILTEAGETTQKIVIKH
jgi:predicted outer membrane repeat protein